MKNCIIILFMFSFVFISCSLTKTMTDKHFTYKVKQIESNDFLYIIDVTRNDSIFRVISSKEPCNINFKEIKIKNNYPLNLLRLYPNEFIERKDNEVKNNPKDSCFISINKNHHYSLYIASNLRGLCLSDDDKNLEEIMSRFGIYTIFCDACKGKNKFLLRLFMK